MEAYGSFYPYLKAFCALGPHVFLLKELEQGNEKTADTIKQPKPLHCI
jgi:hypothetical protein